MPLLSTRVGPYEVLSLLGTGGMGEVYRARDSRLNRVVALKLLYADRAADDGGKRRFEQEAKAAGSLNHPNVLAIYDVGNHDGQLYIVSELLEGKTLRDRLREGAIPASKALEYALQVARGLSAAHRKGITHRDLKPENLFIANDGLVKILDFGLAKLQRSGLVGAEQINGTTELMTAPGMVMGTPAYMAPEQVRGQATDHRSDLFSFGVILHEMVSGKHPFVGESAAEVMSAIVRDESPDLSTCTTPQLHVIVKRLLEKLPDNRFDTAHDLSFALETLCGQTNSQRPQSPTPTIGPGKLTLTAGLIISLIISVIGAAIWHWLDRPRLAENSLPRFLTYSGRDSSPALSPDGKTVAFASDRDGRSKIWLKHLAGGSEVPLTSGIDNHPRFSPDGSTILFSRTEGALTSLYRVANLGGEARKIVTDVTTGDFSPDGQRIAFVRWKNEGPRGSSALGIVGADGSGAKEIADFDGLRLDFPRWSPDSVSFAIVGGLYGGYVRDTLLVVSADGKSRRFVLTPGASLGLSSVAWTSNDDIVYLKGDHTAGEQTNLVRQNVKSGVSHSSPWAQQSLVLDVGGTGAVVFDTQAGRSSLREFTLDRRPKTEHFRWLGRMNSMDRQPAYSPDGGRIIFASSRSGNMDLWQIDNKTGSVSRLTEDPAIDWDPAFTPDGKRVIWSSDRSGTSEVYSADAEGAGVLQVTANGSHAENPTMTADGQWIVYGSSNGDKDGIWKIHPDGTGATRLVSGPHFNPEVSPDGAYALYVTTVRADRNVIHVVRIADGSDVPFEIVCNIRKQVGLLVGRARWMPPGRAIAFIGQNDSGVNGVYVQDFVPGSETSASRRELVAFDPQTATETLGISHDGGHVTVSSWELVSSIMTAERVPGILRLVIKGPNHR